MAESKIEWTEQTWNPVVGCSVVSPGCTNCYAMKLAARLDAMGQPRYAGLTKPSKAGAVWTGEMRLVDEALTIPLRRRKPTTFFVNSMSDLFHESVPDAWIDRVFAVMALAPQHTFQVLTKRSARMRGYVDKRAGSYILDLSHAISAAKLEAWADAPSRKVTPRWPLSNVWLGVSAEDQRRADERVPDLLATLAAVRLVSAEPLLSGIDFTRVRRFPESSREFIDALGGRMWTDQSGLPNPDPAWSYPGVSFGDGGRGLDWLIVGGESGPNARPMHPDWARSIRDQCAAAGVAFHFKQWGAFRPDERSVEVHGASAGRQPDIAWPDGSIAWGTSVEHGGAGVSLYRVGKKAAGRLLDGVEHNGMPKRPLPSDPRPLLPAGRDAR